MNFCTDFNYKPVGPFDVRSISTTGSFSGSRHQTAETLGEALAMFADWALPIRMTWTARILDSRDTVVLHYWAKGSALTTWWWGCRDGVDGLADAGVDPFAAEMYAQLVESSVGRD